jgi:hypothetical protein
LRDSPGDTAIAIHEGMKFGYLSENSGRHEKRFQSMVTLRELLTES